MIAVALETSGHPASIALAVDDRRFEEVLEGDRAHASDLLPALARLLDRAGVARDRLDHVFVGTGPGSYTGLRVGIATAMGLARGTGATALGIPSGESRTFAAVEVGEEATLLLDARQDELYVARYARTADGVEERLAPRIAPAAELRDLTPTSGVILCDEAIAKQLESEPDVRARVDTTSFPRASALLELGLERRARAGGAGSIEPLYLRPFSAKPRRR